MYHCNSEMIFIFIFCKPVCTPCLKTDAHFKFISHSAKAAGNKYNLKFIMISQHFSGKGEFLMPGENKNAGNLYLAHQ